MVHRPGRSTPSPRDPRGATPSYSGPKSACRAGGRLRESCPRRRSVPNHRAHRLPSPIARVLGELGLRCPTRSAGSPGTGLRTLTLLRGPVWRRCYGHRGRGRYRRRSGTARAPGGESDRLRFYREGRKPARPRIVLGLGVRQDGWMMSHPTVEVSATFVLVIVNPELDVIPLISKVPRVPPPVWSVRKIKSPAFT